MKIYTLNHRLFKLGGKLMSVPPPSDEVTIGNQTWKKTNLAIDDGQGGISTAQVTYDGGLTYVTEYYYTFDAAVRVGSSVPGWHLPTSAEWKELVTLAGGSNTAGAKLKSTYGWSYNGRPGNGTDEYGFKVLPAGLYQNGQVADAGISANFWQNTKSGSTKAFFIYLHAGLSSTGTNTKWISDGFMFSVRLVKDS